MSVHIISHICLNFYLHDPFNYVLILVHFMKGGIFTIYQRMQSEFKRIETQINTLKNKIQNLPAGKLICSKNQNRYKWYQSDGHSKTYIPKSNRKLAEDLATKKYLSLSLEDLENEKRAIQFYLNHHAPTGKAEKLLTESSEYQNLLSPYFSPLNQELSDWMNSPYEHNISHSENLKHNSISGNILRSKAESMIDMLLFIHKIPFRYECPLQLNEKIIYPDFTIRHPKTGEYYYWEHFGMMDDPTYSKSTYLKLQLYNSCGIIPSIQLITTYETSEHPLSAEQIEKIIEYYFL